MVFLFGFSFSYVYENEEKVLEGDIDFSAEEGD